jgi:hypothetical protein
VDLAEIVNPVIEDGEVVVPREKLLARGRSIVRAAPRESSCPTLSPNYGISENLYLTRAASSTRYEVTVVINADGTWSYDETTVLQMREFDEPLLHTDHNTLRKVS